MAGRGDKCEQKTESRGFCNKKGIRRQVVAMPTKVIEMIQGLRAKGFCKRGDDEQEDNGMRGEECSVVWRV